MLPDFSGDGGGFGGGYVGDGGDGNFGGAGFGGGDVGGGEGVTFVGIFVVGEGGERVDDDTAATAEPVVAPPASAVGTFLEDPLAD